MFSGLGLLLGGVGKLIVDVRAHGRDVLREVSTLRHDLAGLRLKVDHLVSTSRRDDEPPAAARRRTRQDDAPEIL